jgi:hypothetical protein
MGRLVRERKDFVHDDTLSKKVGTSPLLGLEGTNKTVDVVTEKDLKLMCGNKALMSAFGR